MSTYKPFLVEQYLSELEHGVKFNFSESGVHPMTLGELLELGNVELESLSSLLIDYPQVNGSTELRETISGFYSGTDADNVLITVGATEANTLVANTLLEPRDSVVCFRPTYEQIAGNALNKGHQVHFVDLVEADDWAVDISALNAVVDDKTRIIHVVNPNNPTGRVLSQHDRDAIVTAAERVGAWIVADEVYIGTEREGDIATPSYWGTYDRVVVINSMSKAYGLPGLRLGWMVAPHDVIVESWRRHEYASISASMLSMELAGIALQEPTRAKLTARARKLIRTGFDVFKESLAETPGVYDVVAPQASAMSFVRFDLPIKSGEFASRLLKEHDLLIIPGDRFGVENHFRFSSALLEQHLRDGLERMKQFTKELL